jgi:hypothetical protein
MPGLRILGLLFLLSFSAGAQTSAPSLHPSWLRLLHYQSTFLGAWQSSISSAEFFLSPDGEKNPEHEWEALLRAAEGSNAAEVACRFPARVLLYERFLQKSWPASLCPDYVEWKERLDFHSLSLVYSTAYAGNPASILGHNILKFNRFDPRAADDPESGLPLLDYGLGFMAQNDPTDGAVFYVLNGLFGGYPGFFMLQPYYELVNTYAYAENRDLWEVELPMAQAERELFLAHVWELIHRASTPYYFTHVNCSTMLLEVLEAVRPDWSFRERIKGLVLPQAVMQTVAAVVGHGHESFWPSQKRIFQKHWQHLKQEQQDKFLDWRAQANTVATLDDPLLLDTMLHQLNLQKAGTEVDEQGALRAQEDQILLARARLPGSTLALPDRTQAGNNPLAAHGLHKLSVLGGREGQGALFSMRLRWGLHDLLDAPQGFNPYYHINFFDLSLWQRSEEKTPDYRLNIVELMSLQPFERVDPAGSWAVICGVQREDQGPRPRCRGAYGIAGEVMASRSLFYVLPGMNLTITSFSLEIRGGWYHAWTDHWRQLIEVVPKKTLERDSQLRWDWSWEQRVSLNRSWQVEWRLAREEGLQTLVGLGQFF